MLLEILRRKFGWTLAQGVLKDVERWQHRSMLVTLEVNPLVSVMIWGSNNQVWVRKGMGTHTRMAFVLLSIIYVCCNIRRHSF